jgi:hypothetical protein
MKGQEATVAVLLLVSNVSQTSSSSAQAFINPSIYPSIRQTIHQSTLPCYKVSPFVFMEGQEVTVAVLLLVGKNNVGQLARDLCEHDASLIVCAALR